MTLMTQEQEQLLLTNGQHYAGRVTAEDFKPVVKLFFPSNSATWLLSELDPNDPDIAFGLCDLGMGIPELGNVRLSELASVRGPGGLRSSVTSTSARPRRLRPTPKKPPAPTASSAKAKETTHEQPSDRYRGR
jgi:DUF2958 family protein